MKNITKKFHKKILLISILSNDIGYGHFSRCNKIKSKLKKYFLCEHISFSIKNKNCKNIFSYFKSNSLSKYDCIIVDINHKKIISHKNFSTIKKKIIKISNKVMLIDSIDKKMINNLKKIHVRSVLIPYIFNTDNIIIKNETKYLLGPKYFVVDSVKKRKKIFKKKIKNILVTCGGSDIKNTSYKITKFLLKENREVIINIVIGSLFKSKNLTIIKNLQKKFPKKIKLHFRVKNLNYVSKNCEAAFSLSGLTKYELIYLNLPTIVINQNSQDRKANGILEKQKLLITLNNLKSKKDINKFRNFVSNSKIRKVLISNGKNVIDGNASLRIANEINKNF